MGGNLRAEMGKCQATPQGGVRVHSWYMQGHSKGCLARLCHSSSLGNLEWGCCSQEKDLQ